MSRYLALVLLALSASSVLAAPQGVVTPIFTPVTGTISTTIGPAIDIVIDTAGNVIDTLGNVIGQVAPSTFDPVAGTIFTTIGNVIDLAPGTVGGAIETIIETLSDTAPEPLAARAPAELPQMPDTTTLTRPVLGERSYGKVYSSTTLRKRDWQHPTSTKDCVMSEVPDKSKGLSYTHDGQDYSAECISRLALSVPSEERKSCRATGPDAHGYDEQCLYKKAFDHDWKFDMDKAKQDELAWRDSNPGSSSSDSWRSLFPASIADCSVDQKSMDEMKKKKEDWNAFSQLPSGVTVEDDCASRLMLDSQVTVDPKICASVEVERSSLIADVLKLDLRLGERSTTEVAASRDLVARQGIVAVVLGVLAALRIGCLTNILAKILLTVGFETKIVADPFGVVKVVVDVLHVLGL